MIPSKKRCNVNRFTDPGADISYGGSHPPVRSIRKREAVDSNSQSFARSLLALDVVSRGRHVAAGKNSQCYTEGRNVGDFLEDVAQAFNYSRFKVADDFRFAKDSNMKAYQTSAQVWVNSVAKDYGDDFWRTYGTAFIASLGEVLLDFVQGVGEATFIDPLRLGEGYEKGGFGYVEDGLRIVGVFGGLIKVLKFAKLARVGGGLMSCTPTSVTKGVRLASLSFITVEEVAANTGAGLSPVAANYSGAWIEQVIPNISKIVRVERRAIMGFHDLEAIVAEQKGPVTFSVEWSGAPGIPGGGHSMLAYRSPSGAFLLADQFGNSHAWRAGVNGIEIIAGPASAVPGGAAMPPGTVIGRVARFYSQSGAPVAYVLRETVLLQVAANAPLAQRVGIPLLRPFDKQFNLKLGFAASFIPTAADPLKRAAATIQGVPYLKSGIEHLYGWWWSNVNGGIYSYSFARNGTVRWFDINNHKNAQGKWAQKDGFVEVAWPTGTRETWPFELTPSNQTGTSVTTDKKSSSFIAQKVWDWYLEKITGRWRMNCDKWIWNIDFAEDGTVKWSDFYNPGENGRGLWHLTKTGVYVMWQSGSRDEWTIAESGGTAGGSTTVSGKRYPFQAAKN